MVLAGLTDPLPSRGNKHFYLFWRFVWSHTGGPILTLYMQHIIPNPQHKLSKKYSNIFSTDKVPEVQKGEVTCTGSHRWVAETQTRVFLIPVSSPSCSLRFLLIGKWTLCGPNSTWSIGSVSSKLSDYLSFISQSLMSKFCFELTEKYSVWQQISPHACQSSYSAATRHLFPFLLETPAIVSYSFIWIVSGSLLESMSYKNRGFVSHFLKEVLGKYSLKESMQLIETEQVTNVTPLLWPVTNSKSAPQSSSCSYFPVSGNSPGQSALNLPGVAVSPCLAL